VANVSCKVEIIWYNSVESQISISTLFEDTNTPTAATDQNGVVTPPASARLAKIRLTGGVPGVGSAVGTVYFDGLLLPEVIPDGSIYQQHIGSGQIGQAQLKTTSGSVSTSNSSHNNPSFLLQPGGEYSFAAELDNGTVGGWSYIVNTAVSLGDPVYIARNQGTTQNWYWAMAVTGGTGYLRSRYIQSSPPYDLGDGEIPLFIFADIDPATGIPVSMYEAPEAPWHFTGPTNIRADFYKLGKGYRYRRQMPSEMISLKTEYDRLKAIQNSGGDLLQSDIDLISAYVDAFYQAPQLAEEITQEVKNRDMNLIKHPFQDGNGLITVLLDPVADITHQLFAMKEHDSVDVLRLFDMDALRISNTELQRFGPAGVPVVDYGWKKTA
jgi:hypothetical protein